jgi:hypothetical protein
MKLLFQSIFLAAAIVAIVPASHTQAAILTFSAVLNGANESPPVPSSGTGTTIVTIDTSLNTLRIQGAFSGLSAGSTVAHIHSATTVPGVGNAGVATVPTLPGFPVGVTSGSFNTLLDLTQTGAYNGTFITNNGGTAVSAQAALTASLLAGTAYFNVHSSLYTSGEIRGFLAATTPATSVPEPSSAFGILSTIGVGLMLKRKLKSSRSITKEVSKIS